MESHMVNSRFQIAIYHLSALAEQASTAYFQHSMTTQKQAVPLHGCQTSLTLTATIALSHCIMEGDQWIKVAFHLNYHPSHMKVTSCHQPR
jgi:hypothetical protein